MQRVQGAPSICSARAHTTPAVLRLFNAAPAIERTRRRLPHFAHSPFAAAAAAQQLGGEGPGAPLPTGGGNDGSGGIGGGSGGGGSGGTGNPLPAAGGDSSGGRGGMLYQLLGELLILAKVHPLASLVGFALMATVTASIAGIGRAKQDYAALKADSDTIAKEFNRLRGLSKQVATKEDLHWLREHLATKEALAATNEALAATKEELTLVREDIKALMELRTKVALLDQALQDQARTRK